MLLKWSKIFYGSYHLSKVWACDKWGFICLIFECRICNFLNIKKPGKSVIQCYNSNTQSLLFHLEHLVKCLVFLRYRAFSDLVQCQTLGLFFQFFSLTEFLIFRDYLNSILLGLSRFYWNYWSMTSDMVFNKL